MKIFRSKRARDIEPEAIDGERSVASVNRGTGMQARITNILIFGLVIGLGVFLLAQYYIDYFAKRKDAEEAGKPATTRTVATNLRPLKPLPPEPASPAPAPAAPPAPNISTQTAPTNANGQPQLTPAQLAQQRRLKSPVFFSAASGTGGGQSGGAANNSSAGQAGNVAAASTGEAQANAGGDAFSQSFQPSRMAGASAYMLADPSLTVTKGSVIPCNVIPAIDSTLPGIVTCIQSADVWSADGRVLLLERGTKWIGQQRGGMTQGQRRLGMLWTRGETPNHVLIDVDSGTADELGRPGVTGEVDTHFWDRFGGAILVSLIGDVGGFLAATQSGSSGNAIAFPGTVSGAESALSDILKSTINIPPTLVKNQGAQISIYVARDLDFRSVYSLEAKQ